VLTFEQFFAVLANFARNTIAFRLRNGEHYDAPQEIVMAAAKKAPNPIDKHVGSRVRMRRMMLAMSQEKLGDALGLTFQQVQKYEKGTNRIGASRLQQISHILQVPVAFFFEGAPNLQASADAMKDAPSPAYVSDFLATSEGLSLTKAFMRIKEPKLRRRIVDLVEEIAGDDE
jgi:transcriptional regulator with XRE-family HTH domain